VRHGDDERRLAGLVLELELAEGVGLDELAERLRIDRLVDEAAVARLARLGLLERRGPRLIVTPAGRLLLDSILAEIAA